MTKNGILSLVLSEEVLVKKLIALLLSSVFAMTAACSTDVHYDSLSTSVEIDLSQIVNDGYPITLYQRYQFDRDLYKLSGISVDEAWISNPEILPPEDVSVNNAASPDLSILRNLTMSLVHPETRESTLWMSITQVRRTGNAARLIDFVIGENRDIRQYFDQFQQLEIEYHMTFEPSIVTMYWRNNCQFKENCILRIPVSIQFKMEE